MKLLIEPLLPSNNEVNIYLKGAKNALLPILFSTPLLDGETRIKNAPISIKDYHSSKLILQSIGLNVSNSMHDILITNTNSLKQNSLPSHLSEKTRCSLYLLGSLVKRMGKVEIGLPGGCSFGVNRKFDFHLKGLQALNAKVYIQNNIIHIEHVKDIDTSFKLSFPSVGATSNLILYSCLGDSEVIINNCAIEPEICSLVDFLNNCGANICFDRIERQVQIKGANNLYGTNVSLISDRIQIMTYVALAIMHRKRLHLHSIDSLEYISLPLGYLKDKGLQYTFNSNTNILTVYADKLLNYEGFNIKCGPYPKFPTDLQPIFFALGLLALTPTEIIDPVIPDRSVYIDEIKKLGYDVNSNGKMLFCNPGTKKNIKIAQSLMCPDLRGGMACIMAASLEKRGVLIEGSDQVFRGYEDLIKNLSCFMKVTPYDNQEYTNEVMDKMVV